MTQFLRAFQVSDGIVGAERAPETLEELYASPQELEALYGVCATPEDIRAAMALIHAHCNRPSLWPTEIESGSMQVPYGRQEIRLMVTPVVALLECAGRFAMGRRDRMGWNQLTYGLNAVLALTGGRPTWTPIDVNACDLQPQTGILYVPYSSLLMTYNVIRARYIAGLIEIPARLKFALSLIIHEMHEKGVSDRISYGIGRVTRRYAGDTFLSKQARECLAPFVIQTLA